MFVLCPSVLASPLLLEQTELSYPSIPSWFLAMFYLVTPKEVYQCSPLFPLSCKTRTHTTMRLCSTSLLQQKKPQGIPFSPYPCIHFQLESTPCPRSPPLLLFVPCGLSCWLNLAQDSGEGKKRKPRIVPSQIQLLSFFDQQHPSPFLNLNATLLMTTPLTQLSPLGSILWKRMKGMQSADRGLTRVSWGSFFVLLFWVKGGKDRSQG